MSDNYIIGILAGIAVSQMDVWQYNTVLQPILIMLFVGFWTAWGKRYLEDEWRCRFDKRCAK